MVETAVGVTPFHGQQILGFFDHADFCPVSGPGADGAGVIFGNSEAGGTDANPLSNLPEAGGQRNGIFRGFQQMKGETNCGPFPDSRQFPEFSEKPCQ
jgi:hypothetical protein